MIKPHQPPQVESVRCFKCAKTPDQLAEYIEYSKEHNLTPEEYVISQEGTFNPKFNTFACTDCYLEIGMPSTKLGWKAPPMLH